jgi:hypothetical protein
MPSSRALVVLALAGASCGDAASAPHGAPVLMTVYWNAAGSRVVAWSPPAVPDPSQVASAPPFATEIDFVFDRRLDGNRVEDSITEGGVTMERSKAVPPITVASPSGLTVEVLYNSLPLFGGSSSYVLVQPQPAGVPSGSTVTFALDRSNLTSVYGEPMLAPDSVSIVTDAFTVAPVLPGGAPDAGAPPTVGATFQLPLSFSNRPADAGVAAPFVHARAGGADLPVALVSDPTKPTFLYLVPAACGGMWPGGATVDVTIDAGLPDTFGVPLGAGAAATFVVGAGGAPSDGGCGAPDAGA